MQFRDVEYAHAPRPPAEQPETGVDCTIPGMPALSGYTYRATTANRGDSVLLSLYWQRGQDKPDPNAKYFLRLLDPSDAAKWAADLPPGQAADKPDPAQWQPGETVRDDIKIAIPADAAFGDYRLTLGSYTVDTRGVLKPLSLNCSRKLPTQPDGSMLLSDVKVTERWGK